MNQITDNPYIHWNDKVKFILPGFLIIGYFASINEYLLVDVLCSEYDFEAKVKYNSDVDEFCWAVYEVFAEHLMKHKFQLKEQ